jgi:serine/threonine protein kinase
MSELRYGPEMGKILGFDLIVHRRCIEFCMEFGQQDLIMQQKIKADLIEGLRVLHSLKIIHFDIKPENIIYSNALGRYVLIDYGLSSIIKEPIGVKTITYFKGSPKLCSN